MARPTEMTSIRSAMVYSPGPCMRASSACCRAPVGDPVLVQAVVAAALGVRGQPGVPAAEALAGVLARLQLLLVLDNCEHVIGAAAELCGGLLAAADDLQILATSREPLAVAGEARYRLGPPTVPGPDEGAEAVALRLAIALGWWWFLRGRLPGQYLLLGQAAGGAETGSDGWCAAQDWLGRASLFSADMPRPVALTSRVRPRPRRVPLLVGVSHSYDHLWHLREPPPPRPLACHAGHVVFLKPLGQERYRQPVTRQVIVLQEVTSLRNTVPTRSVVLRGQAVLSRHRVPGCCQDGALQALAGPEPVKRLVVIR